MQRLFLLLLAVSLGVSIFVCSQQGIHQTISQSDIAMVTQKSIEPFYYVALFHQGPYENEELVRDRFIEDLARQSIAVGDTLLFFYYNDPTTVPVNKLQWAIAAPIPDSIQVEFPLMVSKWNYREILSYKLSKRAPDTKRIGRIFEKYLVQKGLRSDSSVSEIIYSNFSNISDNREFWHPLTSESQ